jgi:hypothetical protein
VGLPVPPRRCGLADEHPFRPSLAWESSMIQAGLESGRTADSDEKDGSTGQPWKEQPRHG